MATTERQPRQPKPEETEAARVSKVQATLMICTAIILDLIGLIPVVGQYFALIGAFVIFGIWFLILRVPIIDKIKTIILNGTAEAIPVVGDVWVGITAGVILIIVDEVDGLGILKFLKKFKGGKVLPKDLGRTVNKGVRRIENPERTLQAQERLRRIRERNAAPETSTRNRLPMKDFVEQT